MSHTTAKLFYNGRSQAVRLPAAYRFEGNEVFISRDEATGDVVLSARPKDWSGFFAALKGLKAPVGFLSREERASAQSFRDPFDGMDE